MSASCCCFKGVELLTRHAGLLHPVAPRCSLLANKQQEPERRAESLPSPGQEGRLEAEQRESWSVQPPTHTSTLHHHHHLLGCSVISSLRRERRAESVLLPPELRRIKSKHRLAAPSPIVIHRADKYLIPSKDTFC